MKGLFLIRKNPTAISARTSMRFLGHLGIGATLGFVAITSMTLSTASFAQERVDSSGYLKAQAIITNGGGDDGREMVDSIFALAKPGTAQYAEGLYWRGKLAKTSEAAQKDYVRLIVDYSLSPRVPDALLNIGQIELLRGEREKAMRYFDRLRKDYPGHPLQAAASYWAARTLFEQNDVSQACAINAEALAQVPTRNVELKNRIEFQNQRCRGVVLATADTGAGREGTVGTAVPVIAKAQPPVVDDDEDTVGNQPPASAEKPVAGKRQPVPTPTPAPAKPATASAVKSATGEVFAVQVAAFNTKAQATSLVASLKAKGYTSARAEGTKAPYRVKIGKFTSRSAAESFRAELKAKKIDGFITKG